jgi:general stress protein 26
MGCYFSGLREIIEATQTAMLATRSAEGQIHSRAMNPVARRFRLNICANSSLIILLADFESSLTLTFIANSVCHKFEEIQNDSHVNVSFLDPSTTNWAS